MAKVRLEFVDAGFSQLRRSAEVKADLRRRGNAIAAQAGDGFEVIETENKDRAGVLVVASTTEAKLAEARDKALTKAIDAGRN